MKRASERLWKPLSTGFLKNHGYQNLVEGGGDLCTKDIKKCCCVCGRSARLDKVLVSGTSPGIGQLVCRT